MVARCLAIDRADLQDHHGGLPEGGVAGTPRPKSASLAIIHFNVLCVDRVQKVSDTSFQFHRPGSSLLEGTHQRFLQM